MNESITRAAGSGHGQEWSPEKLESVLHTLQRPPRMRTTLYADAPVTQQVAAFGAAPLAMPRNESAGKLERSKLIQTIAVAPRAALLEAWEEQVFMMAACD